MKYLPLLLSILILSCNTDHNIPTLKSNSASSKKEVQNGDLIFHTSTSRQSLAIQIASNSKYSHVGIIYQNGGKDYVLEAVQPVKLTPLNTFINREKDKHYVIKRLKNSDAFLTPEGLKKMKDIGKKFLNKNYDLKFEWSDDKIYRSELVWKIYDRAFDIQIGALQQIKDFDLSDPIVQAKVKERYGNDLPMEEFIITPDRMFQSDKLITIFEN